MFRSFCSDLVGLARCCNGTKPSTIDYNSCVWAKHWSKNDRDASKHHKKILKHDNAWSHGTQPMKIYLETLIWEVLLHSSYSPDIDPSHYHLSMTWLSSTSFLWRCQKWVDFWIVSKYVWFFRCGIKFLSENWTKVVGRAMDNTFCDMYFTINKYC